MQKGTVVFNSGKGWGKILPEGSEDRDETRVFVHYSDVLGGGTQNLLEGEPVEFEITPGEQGPRAVRVQRLQPRMIGRVLSWDPQKGFGRIQADDGQNVFVHHSSVIGRGRVTLEVDEGIEFGIEQTARGPEAKRVVQDTRYPLERFAVTTRLRQPLPGIKQRSLIEKLATDLAQEEPWDYGPPTGKYPVLWSYVLYTFARLEHEAKIAFANSSDGKKVACFNTGLVTPQQEEIFAYFLRNDKFTEESRGTVPEWYLWDFIKESDTRLSVFSPKPEIANYFKDPAELLFDPRKELRLRIDHIIENLKRFPEYLQANVYKMTNQLEGARAIAIKRVRRNYKTAVPQFYKGKLQLLLPLCLETPEKADLALVVASEGGVYIGYTVLTLDMAYNNARLIAKPNREWL